MKRLLATFGAVAVGAAISLPGLAGASRISPSDQGGRCTGRPFERVEISSLAAAEQPRAVQADRNHNSYVCRMDIPGRGGGNTANNSNIKDDKV
jgi:hypothetical protein